MNEIIFATTPITVSKKLNNRCVANFSRECKLLREPVSDFVRIGSHPSGNQRRLPVHAQRNCYTLGKNVICSSEKELYISLKVPTLDVYWRNSHVPSYTEFTYIRRALNYRSKGIFTVIQGYSIFWNLVPFLFKQLQNFWIDRNALKTTYNFESNFHNNWSINKTHFILFVFI